MRIRELVLDILKEADYDLYTYYATKVEAKDYDIRYESMEKMIKLVEEYCCDY